MPKRTRQLEERSLEQRVVDTLIAEKTSRRAAGRFEFTKVRAVLKGITWKAECSVELHRRVEQFVKLNHADWALRDYEKAD